jgi:hypothetical protein
MIAASFPLALIVNWGTTVDHEIAQVVAASFQNGHRASETGTMVKLARSCCSHPEPIQFVRNQFNRAGA